MTRNSGTKGRGYFGIGVFRAKTEANIGTLWHGAFQLGADFIFTIGNLFAQTRYPTQLTVRQAIVAGIL